MSGAPNRPSRLAFGPLQLQEKIAALAPDRELPASVAKLLLWQIAGLGLGGNAAWAKVTFTPTGNVYSVTSWGSVARPDNQNEPKPSIIRNSTGMVTLTYPDEIADQDGNMVATQFYGALAIPQGATAIAHAQNVLNTGYQIEARFFNLAAALAAIDTTFFLVVW